MNETAHIVGGTKGGLVIRDNRNTYDRFWSETQPDGTTMYRGSKGELLSCDQMSAYLGFGPTIHTETP